MRDRCWRRWRRALALRDARVRAVKFGLDFASVRWIGRSAATPHPCSGHCCGNPRRYGEGEAVWRAGPSVDDWAD